MRQVDEVRDEQIITSEVYMYTKSSVMERSLGYGNRF